MSDGHGGRSWCMTDGHNGRPCSRKQKAPYRPRAARLYATAHAMAQAGCGLTWNRKKEHGGAAPPPPSSRGKGRQKNSQKKRPGAGGKRRRGRQAPTTQRVRQWLAGMGRGLVPQPGQPARAAGSDVASTLAHSPIPIVSQLFRRFLTRQQ
jgi:hypothetical protein